MCFEMLLKPLESLLFCVDHISLVKSSDVSLRWGPLFSICRSTLLCKFSELSTIFVMLGEILLENKIAWLDKLLYNLAPRSAPPRKRFVWDLRWPTRPIGSLFSLLQSRRRFWWSIALACRAFILGERDYLIFFKTSFWFISTRLPSIVSCFFY